MRAYESDLITFSGTAVTQVLHQLKHRMADFGDPVEVGEWQGQTDRPEANVTWELRNVTVDVFVPDAVEQWQQSCEPNLPWAEKHFEERVGGFPWNPPPSHSEWPFLRQGNEEHLVDGKFSHTYPERFWPKWAGDRVNSEHEIPNRGLRFDFGDLSDLVVLLDKRPSTRQAYLPIWFPEDLVAARASERVPCSLGYHFMVRGGRLHCAYFMRSCDLIRHFQDDAYMAGRLVQWIAGALTAQPGNLTMHVSSLHCFPVDMLALRKEFDV